MLNWLQYKHSVGVTGSNRGVAKYMVSWYPLSPTMIKLRNSRFSNWYLMRELLKIRWSCVEPGQFDTTFRIFKSTEATVCTLIEKNPFRFRNISPTLWSGNWILICVQSIAPSVRWNDAIEKKAAHEKQTNNQNKINKRRIESNESEWNVYLCTLQFFLLVLLAFERIVAPILRLFSKLVSKYGKQTRCIRQQSPQSTFPLNQVRRNATQPTIASPDLCSENCTHKAN